TLAFEWLPAWGPPGDRVKGDVYVPKYSTFGLGLSAGYRWDERLPGFELTPRLYLVWPKVDMHISVGMRIAEFDIQGEHTIRTAPEFRWGKTFGFLGFYLGVSHDFRELGNGKLDRSASFQSGIQFAPPWWRIARWIHD